MQGQPVFEDEQAPHSDVPSAPSSETPSKQSPLVDDHGYKNIPHISLEHVKARRSGDDMTVTGWITNHSDFSVRIDHLTVLGKKQVFQRELDPKRGKKDFGPVIYSGPVARDEHASHAELVFRIMENGDLFKIVYHVEFNRESDGKFVIEEFHEDDPVRDI